MSIKKKQNNEILGTIHPLRFIDPETLLKFLDIKEGMKIADFGCGTGYFTFAFARKVGSSGLVYSIDVRKEKLEVIESSSINFGIKNIVIKRANLEKKKGTKLKNSSLDWVVLVNILFQNKKKLEILEEAKRVLKKEGKILFIEWEPIKSSIGPDIKLRISRQLAAKLVEESGLKIIKEIPVSQFHYGLILSQ